MKTKIEKTVSVDLVTIADKTTKSSQSLENQEEIYILDECGDTLWDRVLEQEEKKLIPK